MPTAPEGIVEALQASLALHWEAIETYETQSRHLSSWGYPKLGEAYADAAEEERGHARKLIDRIEYFNSAPDTLHASPVWPRHDYPGILDQNYVIEFHASEVERDGYMASIEVGDAVTAGIFAELLAASEASLHEIEAIREVIGTIGLDNYLAAQV